MHTSCYSVQTYYILTILSQFSLLAEFLIEKFPVKDQVLTKGESRPLLFFYLSYATR